MGSLFSTGMEVSSGVECLSPHRIEVSVGGAVQRQKGRASASKIAREDFRLASRSRVGDEDLARQRRHEVVALGGETRRGASHRGRKWRKDQQTTPVNGGAPVARHTHIFNAAGWTDDHRLGTPHQQAKAFPLHRRLEASYHCHACLAHVPGEVVGLKDAVSRATI